MKRSTLIIIVLAALLFVAPFIIFAIFMQKVPDLNRIYLNSNKVHYYTLVVNAEDSTTHSTCDITLTTHRDTANENVDFLTSSDSITATLREDTIFVTIKETQGDAQYLTIELPDNTKLIALNSLPQVSFAIHEANLKALKLASAGSLEIMSSNVGGVVCSDNTSETNINFSSSNIGGIRLNGANKRVQVVSCNVGALSVAGACDDLMLLSSNIGASSWSEANNQVTSINNCHIVARTTENVVEVVITEDIEPEEDEKDASIIEVDGHVIYTE